MPRSSAEILAPARTEIARGRPRAALKELETARAELQAAGDAVGLSEALELTRGVKTLAPTDTKSRELLIAALEQEIAAFGPIAASETTSVREPAASVEAGLPYLSHAAVTGDPSLASAHGQIKRGEITSALRSLEKARQTLFDRSDTIALNELLELAQRLSTTSARDEKKRRQLIDAAQQNVRYLSRRKALQSGEEWSDPFSAAKSRTASRLPTLPPMSRREILVAAAIVALLAGGITTWALAKRAPQRVAHAIKCPTGEEGSPTWSPDGKEIAFAKNGSCGTQITIVSAEGGPTRELSKKYGVLPNWSPDRRTIVYRSKDGFSLINVKDGETRLIRADDGDMGASWSPNGKRIAFVHGLTPDPEYDEGYNSTLYTMKPDGSDVRRLIGHKCNPRTPSWSPHGTYLLFACDDGVYDFPLKGGRRGQLVKADFSIWPISVSMSADAELLAFGWDGVEIMKLAGESGPKTLVEVDYFEDATINVAWSPNGRKLAFSITGSGYEDGLYVIDRDGKHRRRLADL
jgi:WD40 repeat protein